MASLNCITKSVTLTAGEQFVLPPGSTILGASDEDAFISTCEIPPLETLQCYVAIIGASTTQFGENQYFEGSNSKVLGIMYNDVLTYFPAPHVANFTGTFSTLPQMMIDIPNAIRTAGGDLFATGTGLLMRGNGALTYILIKTIPSVGNKLGLRVRGTMTEPPQIDLDLTSPFYPLSVWVAGGYTDLPTCP